MPPQHGKLIAATAMTAPMAGLGVWLLYRFDPNMAGSPFLPCLFLQFTGLYCPGCGITRALHALVHGDLGQMMAMNPLLPLLLLAMPMLVLQGWGYRLPLPRPLLRTLSSPTLWIGLTFVYWVARNLPWWPFTWLAPN
ncbi:MAG: DUF2752 domain-containing protein [Lysobacter sp.]